MINKKYLRLFNTDSMLSTEKHIHNFDGKLNKLGVQEIEMKTATFLIKTDEVSRNYSSEKIRSFKYKEKG